MVKIARRGGRSGWPAAKLFLFFAVLVATARFALVRTGQLDFDSCAAGHFCLFPRTLPHIGTSAAGRNGSNGAMGRGKPREDKENTAIEYYSVVFRDLIMEGFLSPASDSLVAGNTDTARQVRALRRIGVADSIGVSQKPSPPLVLAADMLQRLPFRNGSFDFVYSGVGVLEGGRLSTSQGLLTVASELSRVVKPDWFLVIHTHSAGDPYSLDSLLALFPSCRLVKSRDVRGLPWTSSTAGLHEIVLRKETPAEERARRQQLLGDNHRCRLKRARMVEMAKSLEPLILEEPLRPWIDLKRNIRENVRYLPRIAGIGFKRQYIYVDVGARGYGSSIGGWFRHQYPKQGHEFEVYAIEADDAFRGEYIGRKGVTLLPYAAWVRNETLQFEFPHGGEWGSHEEGVVKTAAVGLGTSWGMGRVVERGHGHSAGVSGRVKEVQGFDLAEWLRSVATVDDLVVVKMDVEGAEFELVPRMLESGVMCLVDEMFLECHYNRWQRCCPGVRTPKYKHTYGDCLRLFRSLREAGVLVHQWW